MNEYDNNMTTLLALLASEKNTNRNLWEEVHNLHFTCITLDKENQRLRDVLAKLEFTTANQLTKQQQIVTQLVSGSLADSEISVIISKECMSIYYDLADEILNYDNKKENK
jgi:hypothetical protein